MTSEVIKALERGAALIKQLPIYVAGMGAVTFITTIWSPETATVMAILIIAFILLMFLILSGSYIKISLAIYKQVQEEEDKTSTETWREKMSAEGDDTNE